MATPAAEDAHRPPPDDADHFRRALEDLAASTKLGAAYPLIIGRERRQGRPVFEDVSPIDRRIVFARFQAAAPSDWRDAVAGAYAAWDEWRQVRWQDRVNVIRRAADLLSARRYALAAAITVEIGKNRIEALYDIAETVDVMRYYADDMERHDGYRLELRGGGGPPGRAIDVLRPYGVWAVISPFNFPMALGGGPASAALVAGNAVVFKPSSLAPAMAYGFAEALHDAGLPSGALNVITGGSGSFGPVLVDAGLAGIVFTGSADTGQWLRKAFLRSGIPVIAEMGGKNPSLVLASADLDAAAAGVTRSAFGFAGQKCSANSRTYVAREIYGPFLERVVHQAAALVVGDPRSGDEVIGPVIDGRAVRRFLGYVRAAAVAGGKIELGGHRRNDRDLRRGNFVEPTIISGLPPDHPTFREELFVPILAVAPVDGLDEGLALANRSAYGLTAGIYSGSDSEIERFLDRIEAGLVYVNRPRGATTGARVNQQTFGGWKGSGTSGANAYGPYYLRQFMHEQNQTFVN